VSNKLCIPNENKPDYFLDTNKYINSETTEIPSDIRNNGIDENRDKIREQQRKWHLSELEGYVSDECYN